MVSLWPRSRAAWRRRRLFGESIVEGREALGTRDGDQEVPAG